VREKKQNFVDQLRRILLGGSIIICCETTSLGGAAVAADDGEVSTNGDAARKLHQQKHMQAHGGRTVTS